MSCQRPDLRDRLEAYVLQQLPERQMKEVEHHLLECEECLENFQEQVPLAGALEHEEREKFRHHDEPPPLPAPEACAAGWATPALAAFIAFALAIGAAILDALHVPHGLGPHAASHAAPPPK